MENFDYVDRLVAAGFFEDIERMQKEIPLLTESMEKLSKAGLDVSKSLGNSRSVKEMVDNTAKSAEVNTKATATVKLLTEEVLKLNLANKAKNDALKLELQIRQSQEGSIARELLLVKQMTAERNRLNLETQKGRAAELEGQIDTKNDWIKQNSDKLSAQKINIGNYPEMMAQMAAIKNEMLELEKAGLKDNAVYADMEGRLMEISRAMGPTSVQLSSLTNSMTSLAQAGKQDTQEFKDMQQQAMALRVNMNYVKTAISGTTSAVNLQADAMQKSGRATFAVSQILRELPSFTYSTSMGFLGMSNNIMPAKDAIDELKKKNEELIASGQKAIPIWKTLGLAIFSVNGIITLGISAITILSARMAMAGNEAETASTKLDRFNDSLKEMQDIYSNLNTNIATSTDIEVNKAQRLIDTYRDERTAMAGKLNAYMELQGMYPRILTALTDEEKKTQQVSSAHEKEIEQLGKVIAIKNKMAETDKLINSDIKVVDEAKELMRDEWKTMSPGSRRQAERLIAAQRTGTHIQSNIPAAGVDNAQVNKYLDLRDKELKFEQAIAAWKSVQLTRSIAIANIERSPDVKDKKEKELKDNALKHELELNEEANLIRENGLKAQQKVQQDIIDSDRSTYEERMAASKEYYSLQRQIDKNAHDTQIADNVATLAEIDKIKNIKEADREQAQQDLLGREGYFLLKQLEIRENFKDAQIETEKSASAGIIAIHKSEVDKRMALVADLNANIESQEAQAQEALRKQYETGTLSYEVYTNAKKKLEDRFQLARLLAQKAFYQEEISQILAINPNANVSKLSDALKGVDTAIAKLDPITNPKKDKTAGQKELEKLEWEAVSAAIDTAKNLMDGYYNSQLAHQQNLLDAIAKEKDARQNYIDNSMMNDRQKAAATQSLNAQTAAKEAAALKEINNIKRKQAIADRAAALLEIAEKTAIAVMYQATLGDPYTLAARVAAVIGLGAAQAAAVIATPMPQYGDGVKGHLGGQATLGDKYERELVLEPGKDPYWSEAVPTVYDLKRGTDVIPARMIPEADLLANSFGFMTPSLIQGLTGGKNDNTALEHAMINVADRVEAAVRGIPVQKFSLNNGSWEKSIEIGGSQITYINKNLC